MKKPVFVLFSLVAATLFCAQVASSHNNSAPSAACMDCHAGESSDAMIKLEGLPKTYKPGAVYRLTLRLEGAPKSLGDIQGGFSVQAEGGTLVVTDKKHTQLVDGFLTHNLDGSMKRTWSFQWRAPAAASGKAQINVMAVAANGDYSTVGDVTGAATFSVAPAKK